MLMAKILFLEDEPTIAEVLVEYMMVAKHEVSHVMDGHQAMKLVLQKHFDLAVLDIMVPGISGMELLQVIRENKIDIPVIMLTAIDDEPSQIKAFNYYADDYVIKPVSPLILLKRIETILRRSNSIPKITSGLIIHESSYQAYYNNQPLQLTLSEYLLLYTLMSEPNRVFNREQLILKIFNEDYIGNDRIIDAHIKNLRKKLPIDCIKTIIGIGYKYSQE